MKKTVWLWLGWLGLAGAKLAAENPLAFTPANPTNPTGRLSVPATQVVSSEKAPFEIPRPAHAANTPAFSTSPVSTSAQAERRYRHPRNFLSPRRNTFFRTAMKNPALRRKTPILTCQATWKSRHRIPARKSPCQPEPIAKFYNSPLTPLSCRRPTKHGGTWPDPSSWNPKNRVTWNRIPNPFGFGTNLWKKSESETMRDAEALTFHPTAPEVWDPGSGMPKQKLPTWSARYFTLFLEAWVIPPRTSWVGQQEIPAKFRRNSNIA